MGDGPGLCLRRPRSPRPAYVPGVVSSDACRPSMLSGWHDAELAVSLRPIGPSCEPPVVESAAKHAGDGQRERRQRQRVQPLRPSAVDVRGQGCDGRGHRSQRAPGRRGPTPRTTGLQRLQGYRATGSMGLHGYRATRATRATWIQGRWGYRASGLPGLPRGASATGGPNACDALRRSVSVPQPAGSAGEGAGGSQRHRSGKTMYEMQNAPTVCSRACRRVRVRERVQLHEGASVGL